MTKIYLSDKILDMILDKTLDLYINSDIFRLQPIFRNMIKIYLIMTPEEDENVG